MNMLQSAGVIRGGGSLDTHCESKNWLQWCKSKRWPSLCGRKEIYLQIPSFVTDLKNLAQSFQKCSFFRKLSSQQL